MEDPEKGKNGVHVAFCLKEVGPSHPTQGTIGSSNKVEDETEAILNRKIQNVFRHARDRTGTNPKKMEQLGINFLDMSDEERVKLSNKTDERGNTALHYAAKTGNLQVCQQLYNNGKGADINARGQNKMTPLEFASRYGDEKCPESVWECMKWIMEVYKTKKDIRKDRKDGAFDILEKDKYDFNILHHAIQNSNWEAKPIVARNLIQYDKGIFKITDLDKQGNNCLHLAAQFDTAEDHKILDIFLDNQFIKKKDLVTCITTKNNLGKTPLHVACSVGNIDSLNALLNLGKKHKSEIDIKEIINMADIDGYRPLDHAIESENQEVVDILIKENAEVTDEAIFCSARTGNVETIRKLIKSKEENLFNEEEEGGNQGSSSGLSGLAHTLQKDSNPRMLKRADTILSMNSQAEALEESTVISKALCAAVENNKKEMVEFLTKRIAVKESLSDVECYKPTLISFKEGNIEIAQKLLNLQTVKATDKSDRNLFHYAFMSQAPEDMTKILVEFCNEKFTRQGLEDLLTAKDLSEETPFHVLAGRHLRKDQFDKIFKILENSPIQKCLKEKNERKQTPFHKAAMHEDPSFIEAVLDLGSVNTLLAEKDENSNTGLHLAANEKRTDIVKLILKHVSPKQALKFIAMKNIFGWTPFSGAVVSGNLEAANIMLKDLSRAEKRNLINQPDLSNTCPIHLAAKLGHVEVFNMLLENGGEITKKETDSKTALDIAINFEQRAIIQAIINGPHKEEAFRAPSTSEKGQLDTPLRKLIRQLPDLAEEFLDTCCVKEIITEENSRSEDGKEVIKMNYEFIEDTYSYKILKRKKMEPEFYHAKDTTQPEETKKHVTDISNHPMMIMARKRKVDLLQHPLCLSIILGKWANYGRTPYYATMFFYTVFLLFISVYVTTSLSPINEKFGGVVKCSPWFEDLDNATNLQYLSNQSTESLLRSFNLNEEFKKNKVWLRSEDNYVYGIIVIILFATRVLLFLGTQEYLAVFNKIKEFNYKRPQTAIRSFPSVFATDALVYMLSLYIVISGPLSYDDSVLQAQVQYCGRWQVIALTITLAWINLLLYMRLLYGIGKYIIIFKDVLKTFLGLLPVFFILLTAFSLGFHILLSNKENFGTWEDSMLKTMIMMSGELDYTDIFFQGHPPEGWKEQWDPGHEKVPFPGPTYGMFIVFFLLLSLVALNVLVGLTVDDIRNFLENADLNKLTMKIKYTLEMEKNYIEKRPNKQKKRKPFVTKRSQYKVSLQNDLISTERIWEKVERKQDESRRRAEVGQEQKSLRETIHEQTKRLQKLVEKSLDEITILRADISSLKDTRDNLPKD